MTRYSVEQNVEGRGCAMHRPLIRKYFPSRPPWGRIAARQNRASSDLAENAASIAYPLDIRIK